MRVKICMLFFYAISLKAAERTPLVLDDAQNNIRSTFLQESVKDKISYNMLCQLEPRSIIIALEDSLWAYSTIPGVLIGYLVLLDRNTYHFTSESHPQTFDLLYKYYDEQISKK